MATIAADAKEGIPETVDVTHLALLRADPVADNLPF
jgi:hypothetical protein